MRLNLSLINISKLMSVIYKTHFLENEEYFSINVRYQLYSLWAIYELSRATSIKVINMEY